ncbi:MAG: hypothetical protein CL776_02530 [Chloroflexi bacterium]|nr:hypothetical protein [Chloroflexota bacterium]MBT17752.1 hypothetical protein [Dehalococcoidia bacterium]|tara:strand:- start:2475 stop:2771 length:297 start_codon:yes stop_codon:yes gene_type:complete
MDILGIGITEIIVILLVSVIFLGPARMVQVSSKMGFYWRTAQKFLREAADAATVNLDITEPEVEQEGHEDTKAPVDSIKRSVTDNSTPDSNGTSREYD